MRWISSENASGLGRRYTPADVATAMRAEGLIVSDSAVLDTVESLRRHSVGAGLLEPLLHEPGVTDVLVNGADQVFVDRGAGLELTDLRFPGEGDVRQLASALPPPSVSGSTMRCLSLTQGWLTEVGCMQCSAPWPHQAPAFRSGCLRSEASRSTIAWPLAHSRPERRSSWRA